MTFHLARRDAGALDRFVVADRRPAVWVALWAAVLASELAALAPVLAADEPVSGVSIVFRLIGGSFAACGLVAWHQRPDSRTGPLMLVTGFGLFIQPVFSEVDAPTVRAIGDLLEDAWGITMIALLLTFLSGGRLTTVADRVLVGALVLQLALEWTRHLFLARDGNFLLVHGDDGIAAAIASFNLLLTAAACLAVAAVLATRWVRASRPRRRAMLPGVAGISCLLLFAAAQGGVPELVRWFAVLSLLTVPAAFLVVLLRSRLARGGFAKLLRELPMTAGPELQASLAKTLGDPALEVSYEPVVPTAGRAVAVVDLDGREVAWLVYDAMLDDDPELVDAIRAAASVAIENQELRDESELRLAELQASRERIVAAGDAERRRLERDLHDGAQQRLVSIALQLRLAQSRIREDPAMAEELVTAASADLAESLAELRELARGIHPAVLEHGLQAALESLATRSPVSVTVTFEPAQRLPQPVELAAFFVASEALANVAKYAGATVVAIRVRRLGTLATIEIADDGAGGADATRGSGLRGLADRVEALGGRLRVASPAGAGTTVVAELPCGA